MPRIRSRIKEFIPKEVMTKLLKICQNNAISDNNIKVAQIRATLDEGGVDYVDLGPGTNRVAVLIDGYVFKIAMDKWGIRDNDNEFAMTQELQPFVINVYETNGLITVSEYVTLLSREEFIERKVEIIKILGILAESYLLGDVGYHPKNFTNWGYRDDGSLVILDFAYIYNIIGDEMLCPKDRHMLQYDSIFHGLVCPGCRKKYSFMDVRRKVTTEAELEEIENAKKNSYKLTKPFEIFKDEADSLEEEVKETKKEETSMRIERESYVTEEQEVSLYEKMLNKLNKEEPIELEEVEPVVEPTPVVENLDEEEVPYESLLDRMLNKGTVPVEEEKVEVVEEDDEDENEEPSLNPLDAYILANGLVETDSETEVVVEQTVETTVSIKQTTTDVIKTQQQVQEAVVIEDVEEVQQEETQPVIETVEQPDEQDSEDLYATSVVEDISHSVGIEDVQEEVSQVVEETDGDDTPQEEDEYSTSVIEEVEPVIQTKPEPIPVEKPRQTKLQVSRPEEIVTTTSTATDFMALAKSRLVVSRPDEESEQEKYERLAQEHGYETD